MEAKTKGVRTLWDRYKYVLLIVLIGIGLLIWPSGKEDAQTKTERINTDRQEDVRQIQQEMQEILTNISGVGQVQVMLTVESDGERQLAQNSELSYSGNTAAPEDYSRISEIVLTETAQGDEPVITKKLYPAFRGALVVCQGGGNADVKLIVTEAVAALTGLSSDCITVAKWQ